MKKRGTSSVPLIMGIIGCVISIPSAMCAGVCTACTNELSNGGIDAALVNNTEAMKTISDNAGLAGGAVMLLVLMAGILGLVGGILGKRMPNIAGILMLTATIFSGISAVFANLIGVLVAILFLIGTAFCFAQKKEEIK